MRAKARGSRPQSAADHLLKEARKAGLADFCARDSRTGTWEARLHPAGRPDSPLPGEDDLWAVVKEDRRPRGNSFEALRAADPLRLLMEKSPKPGGCWMS